MEDTIFFPLRKNPAICFRLCIESLGKRTLLSLLLLETFFPPLLHVRAVVEVDAVSTVDDDDDDDDLFFTAISF